jgi:uncharacterized protein YjiS (DUF1127 family)
MTTMDYNDLPIALPERRSPGAILRNWFGRMQRRRHERLTVLELSRLDAYLLIDMGINPADVRDALDRRNSSILFDPVRLHHRA